MTSILKTAVSAGLSIAMTAAVAAQPATFLTESYGPPGLEQQQSSAVSIRLVIPFGGYKNDDSVANKARLGLSFAPNLKSGEMWSNVPTTGLGLTFDGELYADFSGETLSFVDAAIRMGVDEEDAKNGSATPWIIGGLVVVGGAAYLVGELNNTAKDITRCFVDALTGREVCE